MASKGLDTQDKVVGGCGKYMRGIVTIDENGHINMKTHIFTHCGALGYHGGIIATFIDKPGNVIYSTPLEVYGVDGQYIFWGQSDRWVEKQYTVGPDIYNKTDRIDIWLGVTPRNQLVNIILTGLEVWKVIVIIYQAISGTTDQPPTTDPNVDQIDLGDGDYLYRSSVKGLLVSPTPVVVDGTITGIVTNVSSGKPISGATVMAGRMSTTTDTTGRYKINIAPGAYGVSASASGFRPSGVSITVPSGTTVTQNFALAQIVPGTVKGTVTDSAGTKINGATVSAGSISTKTDSAGNYTLSNVPSGLQQIRASKAGYNPISKSATVIASQTITVDLTLMEKERPDCPGPRPRVVCTAAKPQNL